MNGRRLYVSIRLYQLESDIGNLRPLGHPSSLFVCVYEHSDGLTALQFSDAAYKNGPDDQATVSPIGPAEVPPSFQQPQGGVPMVTCRVCQAMIDISSKREQHVVKCHICQEATVRHRLVSFAPPLSLKPPLTAADPQRAARQEVRAVSVQLFAHLQELVPTDRLSAAELQTDHQPGAESRHATRSVDAGHAPRHLCPLLGHILGTFVAGTRGNAPNQPSFRLSVQHAHQCISQMSPLS